MVPYIHTVRYDERIRTIDPNITLARSTPTPHTHTIIIHTRHTHTTTTTNVSSYASYYNIEANNKSSLCFL
jgi:hypothetical protein